LLTGTAGGRLRGKLKSAGHVVMNGFEVYILNKNLFENPAVEQTAGGLRNFGFVKGP
jgi:hypothetical protein